MYDEDDEDMEEDITTAMRRNRMRALREANADGGIGGGGEDDANDLQGIVDYEDSRGPIATWLRKPEVQKYVCRIFE